MNLKSIARGIGILNVAAFAITAAAAWFLGRSSVPEWLDIAAYVAFGMGGLGTLMFVGATSGSNGSAERAATAAAQPSRLMEALWTDRNAGISTGALLVLGALSWAAIAWLLAGLLSGMLA